MLTIAEEELRQVVSPDDALAAVELAFAKLAEGGVEQPPVMQLLVSNVVASADASRSSFCCPCLLLNLP
jgi:ornithine cyclodeaminase/alanine dehydrogenase-like protein (mu-crystallin family)